MSSVVERDPRVESVECGVGSDYYSVMYVRGSKQILQLELQKLLPTIWHFPFTYRVSPSI